MLKPDKRATAELSAMPKLVRNSLQRVGDPRHLECVTLKLANPDQCSAATLLGNGGVSYNWNGTSTSSSDVQESHNSFMVAITDADKRVVCLLPPDEWNSRRGRGVLAQNVLDILEGEPDLSGDNPGAFPDSSRGTGTRASAFPARTLGTADWPPSPSRTGTKPPAARGAPKKEKEAPRAYGGSTTASSGGRVGQGPKRADSGTNHPAPTGAASAPPGNPPSRITTARDLVVRAQRNWQKSDAAVGGTEKGCPDLLPQSGQRPSFLARLLRAGNCSSGRTSPWNADDKSAASSLRLLSNVGRDQEQPREHGKLTRSDLKPGATLEVLPKRAAGYGGLQRPHPSSTSVEPRREILTRSGTPIPHDGPGPMEPSKRVRTVSGPFPLRRQGNVSGPKPRRFESPDGFHTGRKRRPKLFEDSSEDEPSDGITIGSVDTPNVSSSEDDYGSASEAVELESLHEEAKTSKLSDTRSKAGAFEPDECDSDEDSDV